MKYKVVGLSLVAFAIAGCAGKEEREVASGSFKYLESSQHKTMDVPEDLDTPNYSQRYLLPEVGESAPKDLKGKKLKVVAPSLILPLVNGSHVEEGSEDAKVLFDQINDNEALQKTVWDTVLTYLDKNNIGVEEFDKENNVLITDWVTDLREVESSWYDFTDSYEAVMKKFKFTMALAPHGRTASLKNELIDIKDDNGTLNMSQIDLISKRTEEATFLNSIIAEYDFGIRLANTQRIAKIRQGFNTEMGFDSDGNSAFMVDAIYENTWPRLLLVLRKMGFDVKDLDQSTGLLFVQYNGAESSWWSGLFGSADELDIEKDEYRLKLEGLGEKTSVTFMDNESNPFNAKQVTKIFAPFKDYMGNEDLDI
ncbi:outer membrane protein assembly factor BamC [Glaciecola sp.]|jgi:outer membrane protein assembly factor BamC|uniref:outer membrane protein assembly factor BamC n=1 Tax=Glaciecola sp. MF2-115 TaxID=3384827 RepID=UPI003989476E